MDSPEPPRKPRWFVRWFSPLRWRFWLLTLPLLNILVVAFLFSWPGLIFEWKLSKYYFVERGPLGTEAWELTKDDLAVARVGPFQIEKWIMVGKEIPARKTGFFTD